MSIAEQVIQMWGKVTKTTNIQNLARKFDANVHTVRSDGKTSYLFRDKSLLVTTGRGKSHKMEAK